MILKKLNYLCKKKLLHHKLDQKWWIYRCVLSCVPWKIFREIQGIKSCGSIWPPPGRDRVNNALWTSNRMLTGVAEWVQNGEFHNGEITKRRTYKMAKVTKRRNYKTANVTKRRKLQNGENCKTTKITKWRKLQNIMKQ